MEKKQRFNKAYVIELLERRILNYEAAYGFTRTDGWNQVKNKDTSLIVLFGEYSAFWNLLQEFGE